MPASNDMLALLIEDAELVALYGQRSGKLRDVELVSAVSAARQLESPSWSNPAVLGLQAALNRAVQDIAPVTISDLRDPTWKPFEPQRVWYRHWEQLLFAAFSLLLLTLTSCSTLDYNRGAALVAEIGNLIQKNPPSEISLTVRKLVTVNSDSDGYFEAVNRLRALDAQFRFYDSQTNTFLFEIGDQPYMRVATWVGNMFASVRQSVDLPEYVGRLSQLASYSTYDPCQEPHVATYVSATASPFIAGTVTSGPDSLATVQVAFLCREGIDPQILQKNQNNPFRYKIGGWLDQWGLIYLPALYGAFGATVYYMRRFLDPTVRDPSLTRLALRISMGAFAGVIITWFWAPNNELLSGFSSAGLTIFTVAFLVGFGVEVLFVLLDRLVSAAMAIAKGAEPRASVLAPVYVSSVQPPAVDVSAGAEGKVDPQKTEKVAPATDSEEDETESPAKTDSK